MLRHSSYAVTSNTYAHVLDRLVVDAVGHMDRLFGDPASESAGE